MQFKYNDTNGDGKTDSITVTGSQGWGLDGTYDAHELPKWLYEFVWNTGDYGLQGQPKVPGEMPPPPPMVDDLSGIDKLKLPYDANANGQVTVNTEALLLFSKNLNNFAEPLKALKTDIDAVTVHAGAFFQAFHLENAVQGDDSLQRNTSTMITQALDAIALIQRAITALTTEYDSVEELNSAGADDLGKFVGDAKTVINKLSS